jgi:hypothetical protein
MTKGRKAPKNTNALTAKWAEKASETVGAKSAPAIAPEPTTIGMSESVNS